jgi:hypothetical protein
MITIRKDLEFNNDQEVQEFLEKELLGKVVTIRYHEQEAFEEEMLSHTGKIDKIVFDTVTRYKGINLFFIDKRINVPKDELFINIKVLN